MSVPITIDLSDEVYRRAREFALLADRDLSSILADMLVHNLPPINLSDNEPQSHNLDKLEAITDLSDSQVIALTKLEMQPLQDAKLSELLDKQQSGTAFKNLGKPGQTPRYKFSAFFPSALTLPC